MTSTPPTDWPALPGLTYWDAHQLADCLRGPAEHVLMDVREEGVFAQGHLFYAASLPLSRLELRLPQCVPRRDTCIVLLADDFELIARAQAVLRQGGYSHLHALRGGNAAWRAAGYRLFTGIYVPSKAFGEVVEHHAGTPRLSVHEVRAHRGDPAGPMFVDCRPEAEYQDFTFEGALNCPGAELLLRVPAQAGDRAVVVNCAGRTRSIIGTQSLINAGYPHPVYALENGTMAWHLEGGDLQPGRLPVLPMPPAPQAQEASKQACALAHALGIEWIDAHRLADLRSESGRTTYCFDVRLPGVHAHSPVPGFTSAPGGQLVQSTDSYAPVRRARLVLWDTDQVQAPMTAHWLVQMGWEVYLLGPGQAPAAGTMQAPGWPVTPTAPALSAQAYASIAAGQAPILIDCDDSRAYRRGHLPQAQWLTRSRIPAWAPTVDAARACVFTSSDGRLAAWAASDAQAAGLQASYLAGGTQASAPVLGTEATLRLLCPTDDAWYSPYQLDDGVAQAMRQYIEWETDLLDQLDQEPGVQFTIYHRESP